MIFKLKFKSERVDWIQAKNQLHLLQEYDLEYGLDLQEIEELIEISEEEAKTIILVNPDYDEDDPEDMEKEFSLYDQVIGDDFCIIGSTEWE